jgi:diguanylate cyclase (GGDEF)-like protein
MDDTQAMVGDGVTDTGLQDRAVSAIQNLRGFGLALVDETMTVIWVSDGYFRIFGYDPTGMSAADLVHPDDLEFSLSTLHHYTTADGHQIERQQLSLHTDELARSSAQLRIRSVDGSWKTCVVSLQSMLEVDCVRSLVIRFDRTRDQAPLERAVHLLAAAAPIADVLDELSDYCILDGDPNPAPSNVVIWWDQHGEHISTRSIEGRFISQLTARNIYEASLECARHRTLDVESLASEQRETARKLGFRSVWVVPVTGEDLIPLGVVLTWTPLPPGGQLRPTMFLSVGSELIKLALLENRRRMLATAAVLTDDLTRLGNRAGLSQTLRELNPTHFPVGALFIDIDNFKCVNDIHGHKVGDEVLVQTAARLTQVCRAEDFLARLGGDEFVVVSTRYADAPGLTQLAQRLVDAMSAPFVFNDRALTVGISIGISTAVDSQELATIIERADAALYVAKRSTKGGFVTNEPAPAMLG